jgi:hypothetical protein
MRDRVRQPAWIAALLLCIATTCLACADNATRATPAPNAGMTIDDITENPRLWARRRVNVTGPVAEVLPNGSLRIGRGGELLVVAFESKGPFPQVQVGDVVRVGGVVETYRASRPVDPGPGWSREPGDDLNDGRVGPQYAYDDFYPQHAAAAQVIAEKIEVLRESSR